MQVVFRNLLATGLVALVASCTLNHAGLGAVGGAGTSGQGAGGVGGMTTGSAGAAGMMILPTGAAGTPSTGADAAAGASGGTTGIAGDPGAAGGTTGAAGVEDDGGGSGTAGDTTGDAGDTGAGGVGSPDGGSGGLLANGGTGGITVSVTDPVGCSDGTREGFVDLTTFPTIAACAGGWDQPGLSSTASQSPQCDRGAGNESNNPNGTGCSVADLCSVGWHVCETANEVTAATGTAGCAPAYELYLAKPAFFVSRERVQALVCDPTNQTGTNNVYGCGNIGSTADKSCAPFMHMLRDTDCANHSPWACNDNQNEVGVITKPGSAAGGVLCCQD